MRKTSILALAFLLVLPGILAPLKEIRAASCDLQGNTITVNCEFAPDTYYYSGTLTIDPGVTVTAGSQSSPGLVTIYADDIVVNGTISANAMGSAGGTGTCPGSSGTTGGGACHAGHGGKSSGNVAGGSDGYGFAALPINLGSGGGDDTSVGGTQGGRGGGAIWLGTYSATGTFTFGASGAVTANGENGISNEGGGGSGGDIYLDVGILDIDSGTLTANGGNGAGSGTAGGGGGGGGHIALRYQSTSGSLAQTRQASGGNKLTTGFQAQPGGPGTVYTNDLGAGNEVLTVTNDKPNNPFTEVEMVNPVNTFELLGGAKMLIDDQLEVDDTFTYTALTGDTSGLPELWIRQGYFTAPDEAMTFTGLNIHQTGHIFGLRYMTFDKGLYSVDTTSATFSNGAAFGKGLGSLVLSGSSTTTFSATGTGTFYVGDFEAKSGSTVTHAANSTTALGRQNVLDISATSTVSIDSGATVNLNSKGYAAANGPGAGVAGSNSGGGGSYGGNGGLSTVVSPAPTIGDTYGDPTAPTELGSGGTYNGGAPGGGAARFAAGGTITIDGAITANGGDKTASFGGGGSGGSVWLEAPTITTTGSGSITANGGAGNTSCGSGGAGGGGRVALTGYTTLSGSITRKADGGFATCATAEDGGAGTVYTKASAASNGDLIVDGENQSNPAYTKQVFGTSQTYDNITIRNGGEYRIPATTSLTLAASGAFTGGGTNQPSITIDGTGAFDPGAATFEFNDIDVSNSGLIPSVTDLSVTSASFTESGTGTFSSTVTALSLTSATFTDASDDDGLNLPDVTMSSSTYNNNTSNPGLHFTTFSLPSGSTFNDNADIYYSLGSGLTSLSVAGTYVRGSDMTLFLDTLSVASGGTVTHLANSTTALGKQYWLDISATTSVTVSSGGSIHANARGYAEDNGPGAPSAVSSNCQNGASYGGNGGFTSFTCTTFTLGDTYGSVTAPTDIGSGGGAPGGDFSGFGGGAIKIDAPTVTVDGTISANGNTGTSLDGGGTGGSVWIDATTITTTGSGTISADGGGTTYAFCGAGGGGGGGRVALTGYTTLSGSITRTAYGWDVTCASAEDGGAGTVFTQSATDTHGSLVVDNDNPSFGAYTTQVYGTSETFDDITIADGAEYLVPTTSALALASGGTLTGGGSTQPSLTVHGAGTFDPGAASFTFNDLDVSLAGSMSTVTDLSVTSASFTESGTGTFSSTVTSLTLTSATFTDASNDDGLNLTDISMSNSTYNNNTSNPGLNLTDFTIPTGSTFNNNSSAYYSLGANLSDLIVSGTYVHGSANALFLDTLTVGGSMTHLANSTTALGKQYWLDISATTSVTVSSGGTIDASGKGFAGNNGPGTGVQGSNCGSGGSYSGLGGQPSCGATVATIGPSYGSPTSPVDLGSGGNYTSAGAGGGAVKIDAPTVTIDGIINANGANPSTFSGGGSGGSVWIDATTITTTGSGSITSNGGFKVGSCSGGGSGGGGRIALTGYTTLSGGITRTAYGGSSTSCTTSGDGGAGTVFTKSASALNGDLAVINNDPNLGTYTVQVAGSDETYDTVTIKSGASYRIPGGASMTMASGADCSTLVGGGTTQSSLTVDGALTLPNATCAIDDVDLVADATVNTLTDLTMTNATFYVNTRTSVFPASSHNRLVNLTLGSSGGLSTITDDPFFIDVLTANSGSTVTHNANTTTSAASNTLYVSATTSITVNSGASVTVTGKGYSRSEGPGQGTDGTVPNGAAHGGNGGSSTILGANTNTYGNFEYPSDSGSGGGDDTNSGAGSGSKGGGAIRLVTPVAGTLTLAADVVASGTAGNDNDDAGGSGGSIWIEAGAVTITANLTAGGAASNSANGGCGGGGRIAVHYNTLSYASGTATTPTGCATARAGTTGSVYFHQFGELPVPPVNGFTQILPSVLEVGQNVVISASATDDVGVASIEIYLDGTDPEDLVKTCAFDPSETPAACQYVTSTLAAGAHSVTVVSEDDVGETDTDTTNFTVAGHTSENRMELGSYEKGETTTFSLSFTLSATSTGTLTVTFPEEFTVNSAAISGSGCLSSFGFTSTTLTATKTNCAGNITLTGASITTPSVAGQYIITFTNDNGSGVVTIVDDDDFNISATVDPVLTFNVGSQTGTCDGTFAGNGGSLGLGALSLSVVASSDANSVPHVCTRLSTNAPNGAVVTVRSQNAALASVGAPAHTIPSGSATLAAGTSGYGLCGGSGGGDSGRDATTPVGAAPVRNGPFGGSCSTSSHDVGGLTTSPQIVWSVDDPTQNAFVRLFVKAAIGPEVVTHNDYQDVLTFIATATY